MDLMINGSKTKYMKCSRVKRTIPKEVKMGNYTLERVSCFIYLKSRINEYNDVFEEINGLTDKSMRFFTYK